MSSRLAHIAIIAFLACGHARADLITLFASQDAGLRGDNRDSAEGLDDKLVTRENDPSYSLVQFDLSSITGVINSATLRMEWHSSDVANQGVSVYRFGDLAWESTFGTWSQSSVTWNNVNGGDDPFSAVAGTALDTVNSPNLGPGIHTGTFAEWDVTLAAQEWAATPENNNGLLLRSFAGGTALSFYSLQHGVLGTAPQLILNTTAVPEPGSFAILGTGVTIAFLCTKRRRSRSRIT